MYKILLTLLLILMAPAIFAVPSMQLYINSPEAVYNTATETWEINASDFELWVITANADINPIYDLTLVAAIADTDTPVDGALAIDGNSVMASEYTLGTPPSWGENSESMPSHGIYPTYYHEFSIGLVNTAPETVYDMQPGETGSANGKIFKYQISTNYDMIHFDAYGFYREPDGKFKFAPFSHDAEKTGEPIPEPATLILIGLGLVGTGILKRKK